MSVLLKQMPTDLIRFRDSLNLPKPPLLPVRLLLPCLSFPRREPSVITLRPSVCVPRLIGSLLARIRSRRSFYRWMIRISSIQLVERVSVRSGSIVQQFRMVVVGYFGRRTVSLDGWQTGPSIRAVRNRLVRLVNEAFSWRERNGFGHMGRPSPRVGLAMRVTRWWGWWWVLVLSEKGGYESWGKWIRGWVTVRRAPRWMARSIHRRRWLFGTILRGIEGRERRRRRSGVNRGGRNDGCPSFVCQARVSVHPDWTPIRHRFRLPFKLIPNLRSSSADWAHPPLTYGLFVWAPSILCFTHKHLELIWNLFGLQVHKRLDDPG